MEPRRIVLAVFEGVQSLDVTGPLEVFATASRRAGARRRPYRIDVASIARRPVTASSGLGLVASADLARVRDVDTLLVAGGEGTRAALADAALLRAITRVAGRARRYGSVCSGAFLLAEAGLLDGRRATTHWRWCRALAARYAAVRIDPDAIFVADGRCYTSAGVTAGVDLALALVEQDLGRDAALAVAQDLVVFLRRPGGQSQFSAALAAQREAPARFDDLVAWIAGHPGEDLSVAALAARAGMSERNFARVFTESTGTTPARFVTRVRVEAARRDLQATDESIEHIAGACGFGTAETMRRTFQRVLRVPPAYYRKRFRTSRRQP